MITRKKIQVQISKEISAVDGIFPNTKDYHVRMPYHHMFRSEFRELVCSYLAKLKAESREKVDIMPSKNLSREKYSENFSSSKECVRTLVRLP